MLNYFQFYDLPVSFYPDEQALRAAYLRLSRQTHPDYHSLSAQDAQSEALEQSVFNNQAYNTLKNFEKRVAYILSLCPPLPEPNLPADFLMQLMEWNELLDTMDEKNEKNAQKLQNLDNELKMNRLAAENALKPLLISYQHGACSEEILKKIKIFEKKLQFYLRISKRVSTFASANDK
jgi:molecular chaperone HscB